MRRAPPCLACGRASTTPFAPLGRSPSQAATLATNTRYIQDGILALAEKLLATMPAEPGHMMLTCTGSEANDLARYHAWLIFDPIPSRRQINHL